MAFSDHMNQDPRIHHFHQISDYFHGVEIRQPLFKAHTTTSLSMLSVRDFNENKEAMSRNQLAHLFIL